MYSATTTEKKVWKFLRKLKIELPHGLAIPLLNIFLDRTMVQRDTCTPMGIAALFTIGKTWKQTKCPSTDEWIKKMWCVYIYFFFFFEMWYIFAMEYYSAPKRTK